MKILAMAILISLVVGCGDTPSTEINLIKDIVSRQIVNIDLVKMDKSKFLVQSIIVDGKTVKLRIYDNSNDYGRFYMMVEDSNILVEISKEERNALLHK